MRAIVVGSGVFGLTAALEFRARGHLVTLCDPGPVPHPLAESTDISKIVRLDYGADADYAALGEVALGGWRRRNADAPLFHGTGVAVANDAERVTTDAQERALRAFVDASLPALADAPIVHRRLCVYGDTADGHFWIARHPTRENLVVATGGSGHGFKFAPALGALIADIALGEPHPLAAKFRWRPELANLAGPLRGDAARAATDQ
ncbi:MAG: FAD-dependent oxidoreductase [Deltaproteobacteria bacterium]|nr:FAD-dependent oxidoreductase [Deltaproteobacteria bacterium]MDQ3298914.1 FAD-dependent oxidoreductase [Myxococcota bacterium]